MGNGQCCCCCCCCCCFPVQKNNRDRERKQRGKGERGLQLMTKWYNTMHNITSRGEGVIANSRSLLRLLLLFVLGTLKEERRGGGLGPPLSQLNLPRFHVPLDYVDGVSWEFSVTPKVLSYSVRLCLLPMATALLFSCLFVYSLT